MTRPLADPPLPPKIPSCGHVHKHVKITSWIVLPETSICSELKSRGLERHSGPNFSSCALTLPLPAPESILTHPKRQGKLCQKKTTALRIWHLALDPQHQGNSKERREGRGRKGKRGESTGERWWGGRKGREGWRGGGEGGRGGKDREGEKENENKEEFTKQLWRKQ